MFWNSRASYELKKKKKVMVQKMINVFIVFCRLRVTGYELVPFVTSQLKSRRVLW